LPSLATARGRTRTVSTRTRSAAAKPKRRAAAAEGARSTGGGFGLRLGRFFVGALLVVPPLLVLPGLRDAYRLPKLAASESLALLALCALALALFAVRRVDLRGLARAPALVATLPLCAVVAASALVSDHRGHAAAATWSFAVGVAALVGFALALPRARAVLEWLWWPATVLGAIAVFERLGFADPLPAEFDDSRYAAASLAGNVGDLGAYLVLPLLLAQAWLCSRAWPSPAPAADAAAPQSEAPNAGAPYTGAPPATRPLLERLGWRAVAWGAGAVVWLAALAAGQVLTAVLALLAGSAVFWLLALDARRRWGAVALGAAAVVVALVLTPVGDRVAAEWSELRRGDLNSVLTGRLDGWRTGIHIGKTHPVLGAGPGSYAPEFAAAKLALLDQGVPFYRLHGRLAAFRNAHNEPIELFAELGVLGLLAAAWLVFWLVRGALAAQSREDRALGCALLVALAVLSLGHFPLHGALVGYPFVVAGAWLLSLAPRLRGAGAPTPAAPAAPAGSAHPAAGVEAPVEPSEPSAEPSTPSRRAKRQGSRR
jgi:O-antigen ligase